MPLHWRRFRDRDRGRASGYGRELVRAPWDEHFLPTYTGGGMLYGLEGAAWDAAAPFGVDPYAYAYGYDYWHGYISPHGTAEESPTYGRRADRELRRWARSHGYRLGPPMTGRRGRPAGGPGRSRRRPRPERSRRARGRPRRY